MLGEVERIDNEKRDCWEAIYTKHPFEPRSPNLACVLGDEIFTSRNTPYTSMTAIFTVDEEECMMKDRTKNCGYVIQLSMGSQSLIRSC